MTHSSSEKKIALVTGANRGIGLEISRQLAAQGIVVYMAARQLEDAQKAAKELVANGLSDVHPVKLDVSNEDEMQDIANLLDDNHGHLDILVNNSGVFLEGEYGISAETMRQSFEINSIAPYMLTRYMTPLLQKSAGGRVVNQSSMMGSMTLMSEKPQEAPAYCASKAALNMLTITQAGELAASGIKVNACHPGWVKTRMGGDDAQLSTEEGAKSAVRLALLPDSGPTGGFFHNDDIMPW